MKSEAFPLVPESMPLRGIHIRMLCFTRDMQKNTTKRKIKPSRLFTIYRVIGLVKVYNIYVVKYNHTFLCETEKIYEYIQYTLWNSEK